ncbi:hypothetical protein [Tissierella praeacuta]
MKKIRCIKCGKLLLEAEGKGETICPRCKTKNKYDTKEKNT